ncbi:MAG TPA: lipid II flippase MurJ, partial [Phenylobacterium sp.]|nr:lipid II flippase MurJ [Phenylobacterium sp.]
GAIGASGTQINIFISGMLVSHVNGAASWLAYCERLYQLPQGLVGVAIGVALLPRLSRAVQAQDHGQARSTMDDAVVFAMALTLPAAAALVSIPFFFIDALYTRGAFTTADAHHTAAALLQYGWRVPAFVLAQLFSRAFFARQDTKTPMRYTLIAVAVQVGLGIALFRLVGVPGLAASTAAAWWLNVAMMGWALHRRGLYTPSPKAVSRLIRILVASVALGALLGAASYWRVPIQHFLEPLSFGPLHGKELAIAAVTLLAAGLYPILLFGSGGLTMAEIKGALRRRKGAPSEDPADLP